MKKLLPILALICLFSSCQKQDSVLVSTSLTGHDWYVYQVHDITTDSATHALIRDTTYTTDSCTQLSIFHFSQDSTATRTIPCTSATPLTGTWNISTEGVIWACIFVPLPPSSGYSTPVSYKDHFNTDAFLSGDFSGIFPSKITEIDAAHFVAQDSLTGSGIIDFVATTYKAP